MYIYIYIYIIHFIHTVVQYGAVIQNEAAVKAKRARLDIIKDRGASVCGYPDEHTAFASWLTLCDAWHIAKQIHVEGMATMSACPRFDGV